MGGDAGQPRDLPRTGRFLIVGEQVHQWIIENVSAPSPQVFVGFSAPWNDPGWLVGGIPVIIDHSPDWPKDRWAYVVDGVLVSTGYGEPLVQRRPIFPNVIDPQSIVKIMGV